MKETRNLEDILPCELNHFVGIFFVSVRKGNGEEYEPSSLTSFQRSINRFLRENENLVELETVRQALEAKRKSCRKQTKVKRKCGEFR